MVFGKIITYFGNLLFAIEQLFFVASGLYFNLEQEKGLWIVYAQHRSLKLFLF